MQDRFPGEQRLYSLESAQDCSACVRSLANMKTKSPLWRERHSYLVADTHEFAKVSPEDTTGTLRLTGYVRGQSLSVNRLVHMAGVGTFQLESIAAAKRPDERRKDDVDMDGPVLLAEADPEAQETLVAENEVDPMHGEQTWPTEEELEDGEQRQRDALGDEDSSVRRKKKVPKGTSAYQAEWILDEEDDDEDGSEVDAEGDDAMGTAGNGVNGHTGDSDAESEELEEIELEGGRGQRSESDVGSDDGDDGEGFEEGEEDYDEFLKRREEQREDAQFPDEVDTPRNVDARIRFQKYRGLKNFRNSPWDPMENLPVDYSRIFQFENFRRTRFRVLKQVGVDGVDVGAYVMISIKDFPADAAALLGTTPLVSIFSLLQHENKMSLVSMSVTKTSEFEEPVKSKDELLIQVGFRRFWASPIYSTDSRGGPNNVHKFERFLQPGRPSIASAYLPIQFGPAPVIFLKPGENGSDPALVASGSVIEADPMRIVAKRIILTGHPFKIHKRSVVVRYMFWNPDDIAWFKPVQLFTKMGRTGHIQDSIGTHGHMKCQFDGPVKPQDTICMYLYKRQFPKWNSRVSLMFLKALSLF
jgi:pre-rRNA-processing protein TSR1